MTDAYPTNTVIDDIDDVPSAALEREADALLAAGGGVDATDGQHVPVSSVRGAVRDDVRELGAMARDRAAALRERVTEKPLKATLYALGAGVLLGLILAR